MTTKKKSNAPRLRKGFIESDAIDWAVNAYDHVCGRTGGHPAVSATHAGRLFVACADDCGRPMLRNYRIQKVVDAYVVAVDRVNRGDYEDMVDAFFELEEDMS